ncbi:hypothetical protein [Streptomyces lincolnensis]|uniref:hypothetical protein n=1 Tax=Streptomyces lincolnensis TaxID=1915 RepID=UPI0037CE88E6
MFVDNSGRRSRLLRRFGTLLGVVCLGYAVVLGLAFMGIGTSINPSSLVPFGGDRNGPGGRGVQPQGGVASPPVKPTGTPPTGIATGEPPGSAPSASSAASPAAASD